MGRVERIPLITEIENRRNSRVICYLTGDRQGAEARIGMDIFPYFYDLLIKMGKQKQIDLFIYSRAVRRWSLGDWLILFVSFAIGSAFLYPRKLKAVQR